MAASPWRSIRLSTTPRPVICSRTRTCVIAFGSTPGLSHEWTFSKAMRSTSESVLPLVARCSRLKENALADQRRGYFAEARRNEVPYSFEHRERRVRDLLGCVLAVVEGDDLVAVSMPEVHGRLDLLELEAPVPSLDSRVLDDSHRAAAERLA